MSLFGTSPPDGAKSQRASTLFDDEPAAGPKKESGLFADGMDEGSDSPWTFARPRQQARSNVINTMLPASDVPESYIDAFDALLESGESFGSDVSIAGVKTLLKGSGLAMEEQTQVLSIIRPDGPSAANALGRGEFNVLLALIGLAQEKEEVTLDSVDERRSRLPQPILPEIRPRKSAVSTENIRKEQSPHRSALPNQDTSSAAKQPQSTRKPSFSLADSDPWSSPAPMKQHNQGAHNNGVSSGNRSSTNYNATSSSTTAAASTSRTTSGPPGARLSSGAENSWGVYNPASDANYGSQDSDGDNFGGSTGDEGSNQPSARKTRPSGGARSHGRGAEEIVSVTTLPEKEGIFLFQHRNYEVASSRRNSKVIRRYSDFVWLLDCLHKKYPFRQLPLLPPKRVAINGNHIATDALFIERRRRGLARFANAVVSHPVLREEQFVVMFLTVPTELSVWRKQATITIQEEFFGKILPRTLEDSLPSSLEDLFDTVRSGVRRSADIYISLCSLLERALKRKEGLATEYLRFSTTLQSLIEVSEDTYRIDTNDVPLLNEGINSTARHMFVDQSIVEDEGKSWDEGVIEDFKRQRDGLVSMRDMFDRRERLAKDNIPQLERRIQGNETRLAGIRSNPDQQRNSGEAEKVEDAIMKDKQSIVNQHARGVFIKECIRDEIQTFQGSQYRVSRLHNDWSQERVKYAEMQVDNWKALSDEVENMPMGE